MICKLKKKAGNDSKYEYIQQTDEFETLGECVMDRLIKGIHHVSLKASNEVEYKKVINFYSDILGLPIVREWEAGIMFETGAGIIEVFNNADAPLEKGTIRHFAFAVDDVDACVKAVTDAGYEVFIGPKDIVIPSAPEFPARMAFCYGPLGEEIEFFQEKQTSMQKYML